MRGLGHIGESRIVSDGCGRFSQAFRQRDQTLVIESLVQFVWRDGRRWIVTAVVDPTLGHLLVSGWPMRSSSGVDTVRGWCVTAHGVRGRTGLSVNMRAGTQLVISCDQVPDVATSVCGLLESVASVHSRLSVIRSRRCNVYLVGGSLFHLHHSPFQTRERHSNVSVRRFVVGDAWLRGRLHIELGEGAILDLDDSLGTELFLFRVRRRYLRANQLPKEGVLPPDPHFRIPSIRDKILLIAGRESFSSIVILRTARIWMLQQWPVVDIVISQLVIKVNMVTRRDELQSTIRHHVVGQWVNLLFNRGLWCIVIIWTGIPLVGLWKHTKQDGLNIETPFPWSKQRKYVNYDHTVNPAYVFCL